jgi:O-methyltransferase
MKAYNKTYIYKRLSTKSKRFVDYTLGRYGLLSNPEDFISPFAFLFRHQGVISLATRWQFVKHCFFISTCVRSYHTQSEIFAFARDVLQLAARNMGSIVECGTYKGGSTAKFSIIAHLAGTNLHVFDSFQGLPDNLEPHKTSIFGKKIRFKGGQFRGGLNEVKSNVAQYGYLKSCVFHPGWFSETMQGFSETVLAAFIDVDLASSTGECVKSLYPRLVPGGVIYSQDGHIPLVVQLLEDPSFWTEINSPTPHIDGLGSKKLVRIQKPF